jgi:ACS family hexuronate transporter-like MFS transporter
VSEDATETDAVIGWKLPLTVFILAHVVGTIHSTAVTVMVPVIKDFYQVPYTAVALLITCYSVGQMVSSIPNGNMIDRIGVRNGLLVAHAILLGAAFLLTVANTIWLAYLSLFLMGWGYSAINPATSKGIYLTFSRTRRATAMGIKQMGVPLGGVLAGVIGGLAVATRAEASDWHLHWQTIMLIVTGITVVGIFLCLLLPAALSRPIGAGEGRSMWRDVSLLARDWSLNRLVLATLALNFGQYNFFTFLTAFLTKVLGASQELAGGAYSLVQAVSAFFRPFWGFASDFFFKSRKKALCVGICLVAAIAFAACGLISYFGAPVWFGIAVSVVLGITIASYPPLITVMITEAVDPKMIGSGLGYAHMGIHLGASIGPVIVGALLDLYGYHAGYGLTAAVVLGGVLLLGYGFREKDET